MPHNTKHTEYTEIPALRSHWLEKLTHGDAVEGVGESIWIEVIQKMDEVYSQLLHDEVALEEKNTELEQSQQFILSVLSAMSDVLLVCDGYGNIEQTNASLCELVGKSDVALRGAPLTALLVDADSVQRAHDALDNTRATRKGEVVELYLIDAHGQGLPVDFNCTPRMASSGRRLGTVLVGRPMAEIKRAYHDLSTAHEALKRVQQQLLHSEKMASLGRLVAGVAHELNNPISFVLGNMHALSRYSQRLSQYLAAVHANVSALDLQALRLRLRIDHLLGDLPSLIEGTLEGGQRAADIVHGLKRFSAKDHGVRQLVNLNEVIERAILWVRKVAVPAFKVFWQAGAACQVMGNAAQLQQVLMNLLQNACDAAVAQGTAPIIWIKVTQEARHVRVALRDNGIGIPPENLSRIFDPFFTTKPVGAGTGLGLSISYGIVEQHGGEMTARNHPAGGSEFTLTLPQATEPGSLPASPS